MTSVSVRVLPQNFRANLTNPNRNSSARESPYCVASVVRPFIEPTGSCRRPLHRGLFAADLNTVPVNPLRSGRHARSLFGRAAGRKG